MLQSYREGRDRKLKCVAKLVENWVGEGDVCDIPIGRDDTGGSPVCVFYRDGLYQGKKSKKLRTQDAVELLKILKRM